MDKHAQSLDIIIFIISAVSSPKVNLDPFDAPNQFLLGLASN